MTERDQFIAQELKDMDVQLRFPFFGDMYYICDPALDDTVSALLATATISKRYWKSLRKREKRTYYKKTTVNPTLLVKPKPQVNTTNFINHVD